nr:zf-HC2 domain-containing protein [Rhodococcus sp. (in: high G+C Gram-positive bacteria)]
MNHDDYALWDGAYVLGSLSSSERREFEDHLIECVRCSRAVAELTVLPGLLGAIPRDIALAEAESEPEFELPMPAAGRDETLFAAIRAKRRRTRMRDAALAVAAAVVIAVPVALVTQNALTADTARSLDTPGFAASIAMTDVIPTVIDARAALTPHSWGTTISLDCTYLVADDEEPDRYGSETEQYALTVTDASGQVTRLATWIGTPGVTVTPQATISAPADSIRSVDVRAGDSDEVLLTASL